MEQGPNWAYNLRSLGKRGEEEAMAAAGEGAGGSGAGKRPGGKKR